MSRVLVEGWRFFPHSYALINHFECLELLRRPEIQLFHRDLPPLFSGWRKVDQIAGADGDTAIAALPPPDGRDVDVCYRLQYPFHLSAAAESGRTFIFGTSEFGIVSPDMCVPQRSLRELHRESDVTIVTSSHWSRAGFLRGGAVPERVVVVPLGVDANVYRPLAAAERARKRQALGWDGFVFVNVGAMSANKGLDVLLRAFATVVERHPTARLVLKGLDTFYESRQRLAQALQVLTDEQRRRVEASLTYLGASMSSTDVAGLYQAADVYVSPYLAEGFNMPVLEAIACGTPVICTQGGPTDDFVDASFAQTISSKLTPTGFVGDGTRRNLGFALKPDLDHLVALMVASIGHEVLAARARLAGPAWVAERFTWKHVVDQLMGVLLPGSVRTPAHA